MTDEPTDEALENLFVEETGFDPDDFPAAILGLQTFYFGGVTGHASRCFLTSFAWPVAVPASS